MAHSPFGPRPLLWLPDLRFRPVEEIGRRAAIDQEVAPGDKTALGPHDEGGQRSDLVRRAGASFGHLFQHFFVESCTLAVQFIMRERGHDDARADRVDTCASFALVNRLATHPQRVAALG